MTSDRAKAELYAKILYDQARSSRACRLRTRANTPIWSQS